MLKMRLVHKMNAKKCLELFPVWTFFRNQANPISTLYFVLCDIFECPRLKRVSRFDAMYLGIWVYGCNPTLIFADSNFRISN